MTYEDDYIKRYMELTDEDEVAELFSLWCGIFTLSAALERKVWVDWESRHYPNQYICLTGDSAVRKSTAINRARTLLRRLDNLKFGSNSISPQYFIKELSDSVDHKTCSRTGDIISHSSICVIASEMTTFTGIKDQTHINNLVDLYDCLELFRYSTFVHESIDVENVCLNMIAGTTPKNLQEHLPNEAIGGGFTSRVMFIYGEQPPTLYSEPVSGAKAAIREARMAYLTEKLRTVTSLTGPFAIDPETVALYSDWRVESRRNPPTPAYDPKLQHYIGRRETHLRKLMMALSAGRSTEMVLRPVDFMYAKEILEATENVMPRALRILGQTPLQQVAYEIIERIYVSRDGVTFEQLLSPYIASITKTQLSQLLDELVICKNVGTVISQGKVRYVVGQEPMPNVLSKGRMKRLIGVDQ